MITLGGVRHLSFGPALVTSSHVESIALLFDIHDFSSGVLGAGGDIGGSTEVNTGSTTTSQSYTWTAPSCDSSSSTSFRALCGAGGSIDAGRSMDCSIYVSVLSKVIVFKLGVFPLKSGIQHNIGKLGYARKE